MKGHCILSHGFESGPDATKVTALAEAAERLGWSGRRLHRCLKVARTVADLAGSERIATAQVAEALQLQRVLAQ